MGNLEYFAALHQAYQKAEIDTRTSENDAMLDEWYFPVGKSAVENIVAGCVASRLVGVHRILDLPCGHGRVTRHLVHLFPAAGIDACDVDADGVRFCAERFGARPIVSQQDLTKVEFPHPYDVIWIGSLFTHVDRARVRSWLTHLTRFLTDTGIIVATFHGRWCKRVYEVAPYVSPERWRVALDGFEATGFGYVDYAADLAGPLVEGGYGVSLARPQAIVHEIESIPGVRLYMYRERSWADHHDVVVVGKPAFDQPWPQMR